MARPILFAVLARYPTPEDLSSADLEELTTMLQPIGLHNIRAMRLIAMAKAWLAAPPSRERRYRKLHYPTKGCGTDIRPNEVLGPEDERVGWEIAHLPGMGAYALDSYRIFFRDTLRCVTLSKGVEPEWKRPGRVRRSTVFLTTQNALATQHSWQCLAPPRQQHDPNTTSQPHLSVM
ncbi:hypothetical protein HBI56_230200 [Parastagonospora nodorum]|nr:hypothetical protein HBH51_228880 [Parastagonospora nodorum]KAH3959909.1 hypothetical protein HBH52_241490 [Parastagonospora nodorum]KAH4012066.1 hypothetical protein HBI09_223680 [Parastagonospora nodorum]KAH4056813.1 hypothetical protein HBH50_240570 [Parastagonospora nodorum]KAH4077859.1 hypothetical protein HBH48_238230 [Parastagonospora nodorum]